MAESSPHDLRISEERQRLRGPTGLKPEKEFLDAWQRSPEHQHELRRERIPDNVHVACNRHPRGRKQKALVLRVPDKAVHVRHLTEQVAF